MTSLKANLSAAEGENGLISGFAKFLDSSNVLEFAVGSILGSQFKNIIDNFVQLILSPIVAKISQTTGTLEDMYFVLGDTNGHKKYANWQQAQQRGAHVIRYGAFLQAVINLTIQVWIVFILVRSWMRFRKTIYKR